MCCVVAVGEEEFDAFNVSDAKVVEADADDEWDVDDVLVGTRDSVAVNLEENDVVFDLEGTVVNESDSSNDFVLDNVVVLKLSV